MLHEAKHRAKNNRLDFDLTYEDLLPLIPEYCSVFGTELNFTWNSGGFQGTLHRVVVGTPRGIDWLFSSHATMSNF